jgi:hypothetical protein
MVPCLIVSEVPSYSVHYGHAAMLRGRFVFSVDSARAGSSS